MCDRFDCCDGTTPVASVRTDQVRYSKARSASRIAPYVLRISRSEIISQRHIIVWPAPRFEVVVPGDIETQWKTKHIRPRTDAGSHQQIFGDHRAVAARREGIEACVPCRANVEEHYSGHVLEQHRQRTTDQRAEQREPELDVAEKVLRPKTLVEVEATQRETRSEEREVLGILEWQLRVGVV